MFWNVGRRNQWSCTPKAIFFFFKTQVGTLNYMPPEAIKDTSSQAGKARSKVPSPPRGINMQSCHFWLQSCLWRRSLFVSPKDQSQRWRVVPRLHPVLHDLWENSVPKHRQSDCQAARHHRPFSWDGIPWHRREGFAGCVEGARPWLNCISVEWFCHDGGSRAGRKP